MSRITEDEFATIVDGIIADADVICRHNPIGTREETLLWMLLSCLVTYLSLPDNEAPCFTGTPDARTYRDAIKFILSKRTDGHFEPEVYLEKIGSA